MALLSCPECSREVSDQAAACPHCGYPLASRQAVHPDHPDERLRQVLVSQGKIAAIKLCCDLTPGLSLTAAKQHVDRLEAGLPTATRRNKGGAGCLLVLAAVAAALWLLVLCLPGTARAADFQGADAVLQKLAAALAQNPAASPDQPADPVLRWRADLDGYRAHASGLPLDEAARAWVALYDRACRLPGPLFDQSGSSHTVPHLTELFRALPPPAAWDALAAQATRRPPPAKGSSDLSGPVLRMVMGTLQNDSNAVQRAVEAFRQQAGAEADAEQKRQDLDTADRLRNIVHEATVDAAGRLKDLEARVTLLESRDRSPQAVAAREDARSTMLDASNLVALTGAPRAEALLRQIFALPFTSVTINDGPTCALARTVALAMGERLKYAPWLLVNGPDDVALYELLDRRFPETEDTRGIRVPALPSYLLGLILQGRDKEATALALKMAHDSPTAGADLLKTPQDVFNGLAAQGQAQTLAAFLERLLAAHPDLSFWPTGYAAATAVGKTDAFQDRLKSVAEDTHLLARTRHELRRLQAGALLAADRLPEAIPILRELAALPVPAADSGSLADFSVFNKQTPSADALALVGIARRQHDDPLLNGSLDRLSELFRAALAAPIDLDYGFTPLGDTLNEPFLAAGRGPEVESLLLDNLTRCARVVAQRRTQMSAEESTREAASVNRGALEVLVDLYARAGRWADIVTLLDHAPSWEAGDAAALVSSEKAKLGGQLARALKETGHADAALRVVNACLEQADARSSDSGPAYALLLELLPADQADARLDALARADAFDAHPPLYRAVLGLREGQLEAAEKWARLALAIDPDDGDGGPSDRTRAHAVLGDILERRGDAAGAEAARRFVRAARLGEEADDWLDLGVLKRATELYAQASDLCPDAASLQYRCAVVLTALGRSDEAAACYERADADLAASSSRLRALEREDGGIFSTAAARAVAERVLGQIAGREPANARVRYLLGILRVAQGRSVEARREFRDAARLDPDHLSAWDQLVADGDPVDRSAAVINLLRLDPRHRHTSQNVDLVNDLRGLWPALDAAVKRAVPAPADLYPLAASRTELARPRQAGESLPADAAIAAEINGLFLDAVPPPWAAVLRHPVISAALQILRSSDDGDTP